MRSCVLEPSTVPVPSPYPVSTGAGGAGAGLLLGHILGSGRGAGSSARPRLVAGRMPALSFPQTLAGRDPVCTQWPTHPNALPVSLASQPAPWPCTP